MGHCQAGVSGLSQGLWAARNLTRAGVTSVCGTLVSGTLVKGFTLACCRSPSALAVTLLLFSGCAPDRSVPRVAISGEVTLDGKPLTGVTIRFVPTTQSPGASAMVMEGKFQMDPSQGPAEGEYDVVIEPNAPDLEQAIMAMQAGDRDPLRTRVVPQAYQVPGQLVAKVSKTGDTRFHFKLTSNVSHIP